MSGNKQDKKMGGEQHEKKGGRESGGESEGGKEWRGQEETMQDDLQPLKDTAQGMESSIKYCLDYGDDG